MSLTSTIRFPAEFTQADDWYANGLVGFSSPDQNVYIWQLKAEVHSQSILVITQVNPLVPSSWKVLKELKLGKIVNNLCSCFNAAGSKLAFRYRYYQYENVEDAPAQFELLLVDLTTGQAETRAIVQLPGFNQDDTDFNSLIIEEAIKFAETSIGWVAVSCCAQQIFCYKMFPEPGETQILANFVSDFYRDRHNRVIGLTYDSLMYIRLINSPGNPWQNCKLISYDFLAGNSNELPFDDPYLLAAHTRGPMLVGNSEGVYLFRSGWPLGQTLGTRVYQIHQDHLGINLQFLTRFDDEFIDPSNPITAGDGKMVMIHFFDYNDDAKYLIFVNMTLPSLKSLSVLAIQKLYGTVGNHGELLDGITEEKLRNLIGYKWNKKLF